MRLAAVILAALVVGCSAQQKAQDATREATKTVTDVRQNLEQIDAEAAKGYADPPEGADLGIVRSQAQAAITKVDKVQGHLDEVSKAIPQLEDQVPFWQRLLYVALIVVALGGVIYLLIRSGLLHFIRGWIGIVTPEERQDANLLAKVRSPSHTETVDEYIAKRRALPSFNKAFKVEQKDVDAETGKIARKEIEK